MQYRWHFVLALLAAVALASCSAPTPTPTTLPPTAVVAPATAVPATAAPQATATKPAATIAPTDAPKPTATTAPPSSPVPTQAAKATAATTSSGSKPKVNVDELFPPGPGRQLVLDNCMNCHSMAPIVVSQKSKPEWNQLAIVHRDKVSRLSDDDFNELMGYLIATFNPNHPVPQLPDELLSGWTNY